MDDTTTAAGDTTDTLGALFFNLGAQRWGVLLADVVRALPAQRLRLVLAPNCPAWVLGVAQVDGQILTVLDLAHWLGEPPAPPRDQWRDHIILLVEHEETALGLLVAATSMTALIPRAAVVAVPPATMTGADRFTLARYEPGATPSPEAGAARALLDIRRLAAAALATLLGGGDL